MSALKKTCRWCCCKKLRENACCSKSGMVNAPSKKGAQCEKSLVIEGSHIFGTWFLVFFCACANLLLAIWRHYPLPIWFHLPFFRECKLTLRNICKRHCYLAKVQSGTIGRQYFFLHLQKEVSNSLPQVYVTITISTWRYYETWHRTQNTVCYDSAWWWSLDEFARKKQRTIFSLFSLKHAKPPSFCTHDKEWSRIYCKSFLGCLSAYCS